MKYKKEPWTDQERSAITMGMYLAIGVGFIIGALTSVGLILFVR